MKPHIVLADILAAGGVLGSVFNFLPQVVGTVAGLLGCAWYAILIYDRIVLKRNSEHPYHRRGK